MSFLSDYVAYFENLTRLHVDIKHTDIEKHFFRMELDELLSGLPSEINFPAFILEAYDINFISRQSNNILKSYNGAFTVLIKISDTQDFDSIHQVWEDCEKIGTDFIIMMYNHRFKLWNADTYDTDDFIKSFDVNSVEGMPVAKSVDGTYGFRFTFSLIGKTKHNVIDKNWLVPA